MDIKNIKAVYFIGAGGIGMSAIARYFMSKGLVVAGYDKTPSALTNQMEKEGMLIHYDENVDEIPHACRDAKTPSRVSWSIHQPYRATTKSWFSSYKTASKYKSALSCWVR